MVRKFEKIKIYYLHSKNIDNVKKLKIENFRNSKFVLKFWNLLSHINGV
jgi:hypothetical protein